MKRFALIALLQGVGVLTWCQSMAITPRTAQSSPDRSSVPQPQFDFDNGNFAQISSSAKSKIADFCHSPNANQNQKIAKAGGNQIFHVRCMNPNTFQEMAILNLQPSQITEHWPSAKLEPIPTQWPDAKIEQIPTMWPNLKMLQIKEHNPSSVPAK